ncbi:glycosyltransferase family 2 protein [Gemmobacter serpentinus]|uniref:glycosyltransferase family 2 protein n=1 Tax=Gemmobacter serpentinus TaxID=2652247 RepID=UPI00124C7CFE|nr:glycosyltransferase family 2 protein [Gemmobacter serpentinus]
MPEDRKSAKQRQNGAAPAVATEARVLLRVLGGCQLDLPGLPRLLDAVRHGDRLYACFGNGSDAAALAPDGGPGCAVPQELRAVSGSLLAIARLTDAAAPARLALTGGTVLDLEAPQAETDLFRGLNTILAFRHAETPAQLAEGLRYHWRHHGLQAALIVSRADEDLTEFAAALSHRLTGTGLTVVLLRSPLPLGQADAGPLTHPFLAPDAPGKDRMEQPAPDPWLSPLAEGLIHEALKWRFLSEARAVLTLDACDILAPRAEGAPSAFDLCVQAEQGTILLVGHRIYPWRVRPDHEALFGDHICRQFDHRRGIARWGVAPGKAGLENTWRLVRISYARPDTTGTAHFYRAMALLVPGRNAGDLAPKSALIEDPSLIALSQDVFNHRPVRAPVSRKRQAPTPAIDAGRTAIVTTMKNEGPFILEWLAYHRAIGVDDFLVYTNDCTDGTDTMLELLTRKGIVQHRINPYVPGGALKPQHAALQAAESEPVMQNCGWGICMDVDEFIDIKIGDGTLKALYERMGEANMISLTWRLFGNAEVHGYEDRFIIDQFTRCAPELIRKPHQAWGFKTLFRNIDIYKKLGVHRPKGLRPDLWDQVRWLNGSGRPMPKEAYRNAWRSTADTYGYDWVQLNHYAVRSAESFLVKRDRGRVNHVDRDQGLNYWFRMNHNIEADASIRRMIPAARAEFDRMMADPEIRAAHEYSVACHREKITALMQTENYQAFFAELTGNRMEKLCRMQHHFGSAVFLAGPGVIPTDLHERDLPENFFFTVDHVGEAEH